MSFENFVHAQGLRVHASTPAEAVSFVQQHGYEYVVVDYVWGGEDREAWWRAVRWTTVADNEDNSLHQRCAATRQARRAWRLFLKHVTPWQPAVPPLPE